MCFHLFIPIFPAVLIKALKTKSFFCVQADNSLYFAPQELLQTKAKPTDAEGFK